MALTLQQVLKRLDVDEPDYTMLATLGPEAVPHLKMLVHGEDAGIAAKAAYLASLIESDDSSDVLEAASVSPHVTVRVAAAGGMRNLAPAQAGPTVERLLDDEDAGVRKQALQAIARLGLSGLEPKVKNMAARDPEKALRSLAKQGLARMGELQGATPLKAATADAEPARRSARRPRKPSKK